MITIDIDNKNKSPALALLASYKNKHIEHLYLRSDSTVTTQVSQLLKDIASIKQLTVWSPMTRTALRDCFSIRGLASLNLFELLTPGKVIDASKAKHLKAVNCMFSSDIDLCIFSRLPSLTVIVVHGADWSTELLTRFIDKPLTQLEVENSYMSYEMIAIIASSNTITSLAVGNSGLTGEGLAEIADMQQLESLDIWNTKIDADDLEVLSKLQNLNYLSIGGHLGHKYLNMDIAVSIILRIRNLTSLWIDGVRLTDMQLRQLKQHIDTVRYDIDDAEDENDR